MKQRIKAWFERMGHQLPALVRRTAGMLPRTAGTLLPCGAVLAAWYMLDTLSRALKWDEGAGMLLELVGDIALIPLLVGMVTYVTGACWEKRNVNLTDALHLVRIKVKNMILTGLAAGLVGMVANWLGMTLYSLIRIVSMLLGWIPLLGNVIAGVVACALWLISLAMEFVVHAALVMGMTALTADGVSGRPQLERVINVMRGGWSDIAAGLVPVFGMWVVGRGIYEVLITAAPMGTAMVWSVLLAAMMLCSMTAVSVIYLRQRDGRDGTSYYA